MAEGYRGLLAPWVGGAGDAAASTETGYRGMLAPWTGGAGSTSASIAIGYRGMLAPWTGGAGSVGVSQPGYAGMLAPWFGGGAIGGSVPATMPHRRPSGVFLFGHMGLRDPRY